MKRYSYIVFLAFITLTSSCDYVTAPEQEGGIIFNGRKTLIEDYTGHKCPNCPRAAREAEKLVEKYGDKVIVIGVHADFFANVNPPPYLEDFKTPAGTAYDNYFGISSYPSGLINRKNYTSSTTTHIKTDGSWATEVKKELAKPKVVDLEITNVYNSSTKVLDCTVKSTFLYDTITGGPYKLIVLITQSNIIAPQIDGSTSIATYEHKHVLRDNMNGIWGVDLGSITPNTAINKNYSYTFPTTYPAAGGANATNCVVEDCDVVAFIYNDATKEVIQVEQKKVIP